MKNLFVTLCAISVLGFGATASAETLYPMTPVGGHLGEKPPLSYHIEYRDALGVTTVNASGITYAPFGYYPILEPTVLPARYFGTYPLYFAGGQFVFVVHLKNTGKRAYRNLLVIAAQELLNTDGNVGISFPGDAAHNWFVEKLEQGEEIILYGSMTLPFFGVSGIDQTHLQILHWDNSEGVPDNIGRGRILLDAPQAGLWCPTG